MCVPGSIRLLEIRPAGEHSMQKKTTTDSLLLFPLHKPTARLAIVRRLIFNADDFGLTPGINRSIIEGHTHGVLTSATLMANAPATVQAIQLAQEYATLGVGCHVVLVDGAPLTDPARLRSLTPKEGSTFHKSPGALAGRALTGRLDVDQIESEATAQFRKLQAAGLRLTHFDAHKHVHMFPMVLEGALRAARTCGIAAVRNPFEPRWQFARVPRHGRAWKRAVQTQALRALQNGFQRLVRRTGLKTPDGTVGIAATGSLDEPTFRHIIHELPEGTWEFVSHPGYCDNDLRNSHTRLLESRETELRLLTDAQTRVQLDRAGIELISYADL